MTVVEGGRLMPAPVSLTGRWAGHYLQGDRPHGVAADLTHEGDRLHGRMRDEETETDRSVYEVAAEAGLPPGSDEQIVERLREAVAGGRSVPVRYVTRLPADSELRGGLRGTTVHFVKRYEGVHFSGFKVGDELVGSETRGHEVHYEGRLSPDGLVIEGRWWIDRPPRSGARRAEGLFVLRREPPPAGAGDAGAPPG
jgi:hypothetical protein